MKQKLKQLTALILALAMVMSLLCSNVLATELVADVFAEPEIVETDPVEENAESAEKDSSEEDDSEEAVVETPEHKEPAEDESEEFSVEDSILDKVDSVLAQSVHPDGYEDALREALASMENADDSDGKNIYPMATSADLSISTNGVSFICAKEGFSPTCYVDNTQSSIGYGTKCMGSTVQPHSAGMHSITKDAALAEMKSQINSTYAPNVRRQTSGISMTQNQFDALTSLCYNTGGGNSIISGSPLVKYLKGELTEANARTQYSSYYVYSGGSIHQGLVNRRKTEADLFFTGATPPKTVLSTYYSTDGIGLRWESVSGAVGYWLMRSTSENGSYGCVTDTKNTSCIDKTVEPGVKYYYYVQPYNSSYGLDCSDKVTAIGNCKLVSGFAGENAVSLSWSSYADSAGYWLKRSTSENGSYITLTETTGRSYTDTSVSAGVTYYYKVQPFNANRQGMNHSNISLVLKRC